MMAVLKKSDNDSQNANAQGPSKQPKVGLVILPICSHLSQAAACEGTLITTTATNQGTVLGTLPTF